MSFGRFALGLLLLAVTLGPIIAGSVKLRAGALPGWSGSPARVAEATVFLGLLVCALEIAGIVSAFNLVGVILACALVAAVAWAVAGRIRRTPPPDAGLAAAGGSPRATAAGSVVAVAIVAAPWLGWVVFAYGHGMETVDTLWYHLPFAARFVQTGSIVHLHYVDSQAVTVFYPANSELFHALGLLLFGTDVLSPAINLGWAALALVAAWSIGRRYGRGPHCLMAVLLVLGTPGLVLTQPGGAYNDVVDVALLLCSAALLVNGGTRAQTCAIAAVAAGLALGTKYTMIVPVVGLGAGVTVISPRAVRARNALIWLAGLIALGGFWYVRNAVAVGNPLPSLSIHIGPLSLPSPGGNSPTFTVAQYLTDGRVWSTYYLPGLRQSLGLAWPGLVALAAFGAAASLAHGGDRMRRALGAVGLLSLIAFLFTPQFLGGPGSPVFFAVNVRYVAAALAVGLVLVPIVPSLRTARAAAGWMILTLLILIATELDPGVWPTGIGVNALSAPLRGDAALAGAGLAIGAGAVALVWLRLSRRRSLTRRGRAVPGSWAVACALLTVLAVVFGGWWVANRYADRRYLDTPVAPAAYRWARALHNARIGIVGITTQYPFYGTDSSNHVQYVGERRPHGGFGPIDDCRGWREAVNRGRYRWLVLAPLAFPSNVFIRVAPEVGWTEPSREAHEVLREVAAGPGADTIVVMRISGRLDPNRCPGQ